MAMDGNQAERKSGWRGSEELWLDAAYRVLIDAGVEHVKVGPLAAGLGLSRTSFYGHFESREALLDALVAKWEAKNTGNLIAQAEAYAESIAEGLLNVFDCWFSNDLFDARLDFAVRTWALGDASLRERLEATDRIRIDALTAMFLRHGFETEQARVRAYSVYYTQIGYISMMVRETVEHRVRRVPVYIETFTGVRPTESEIERFAARHGVVAADVLGIGTAREL